MDKFAYSLLAYYTTNLIYEKYFKDYGSWFAIEWECLCKSNI